MKEYKFITPPYNSLIDKLKNNKASDEVQKDWNDLFTEYNKVKQHVKKNMYCSPCYGVVYNWYRIQLENKRDKEMTSSKVYNMLGINKVLKFVKKIKGLVY